MMYFYLLFLLLAARFRPCLAVETIKSTRDMLKGVQFASCSSNSKISSWCDSSMNKVHCQMNLARDMYMCQCPEDPSACPDECIATSSTEMELIKTSHSVLCHGIPEDEVNYILKTDTKVALDHCENNGIVANWCNEATNAEVECHLFPSLNEYVCTCPEKAAFCPMECIEGSSLGRKTKHAIRCQGIPVDSPNYVME